MSKRDLEKATIRLADDAHFRLQVEHTAYQDSAEQVLHDFHLTLEERCELIELAAAEAAAPFHQNLP